MDTVEVEGGILNNQMVLKLPVDAETAVHYNERQ
jgi:hypothetical protein